MKEFIKRQIRKILLSKKAKIVIASTGRAGSTMLFHAVSRAYVNHLFKLPKSKLIRQKAGAAISGFCERFSCIENFGGGVIKTHALWQPNTIKNIKFIFVHGDPLESAISVAKMAEKEGYWWFNKHLHHLESPGGLLDEVYSKDVLNYETHIRSWSKTGDDRVLCIAYEDLWLKSTEISKHVGFEVDLPEYSERASKLNNIQYNKELFEYLKKYRNDLFG